ncbi:aldo/keto reductase [Arthrobacter cupressi]|uniref:Predicted oxidoreductase n=1 Tax=Arthrobacter cupressi TaxID=1045773 RepID=A0A1G8XQY1_9MICC|nr:aldo/keto reductase [Arthrobacter cupressi]NYD77042.1 putative oxidoreductase [Arthrobacter cupressi]SDJ92958.1 Predicted oxidoreductase [Arthrobacter cupressi]
MTAQNNNGGRLIYGCMGLGGDWDSPDYGPGDVDAAAAAIEAARGIGITLFDHADIYTRGKAESVFGDVLAASPGLREQIQLQGKCGISLAEGGVPGHYNLSREAILERVNASLQRLRTDYLDILLLHRPDPLLEPSEVAAAVGQLMAEGKVRALGVSNMSAAQIDYLQDALETPIVANQLEMSLHKAAWVESSVLVNRQEGFDAGFPHGTIEHCVRKGIELQAYGSLAQGRYTGAPYASPTAADRETAGLLARFAEDNGTTPEAALLGWLMKHPAGISPVVGSSRPERIAACAGAAEAATSMSRIEWYSLWTAARGAAMP